MSYHGPRRRALADCPTSQTEIDGQPAELVHVSNDTSVILDPGIWPRILRQYSQWRVAVLFEERGRLAAYLVYRHAGQERETALTQAIVRQYGTIGIAARVNRDPLDCRAHNLRLNRGPTLAEYALTDEAELEPRPYPQLSQTDPPLRITMPPPPSPRAPKTQPTTPQPPRRLVDTPARAVTDGLEGLAGHATTPRRLAGLVSTLARMDDLDDGDNPDDLAEQDNRPMSYRPRPRKAKKQRPAKRSPPPQDKPVVAPWAQPEQPAETAPKAPPPPMASKSNRPRPRVTVKKRARRHPH